MRGVWGWSAIFGGGFLLFELGAGEWGCGGCEGRVGGVRRLGAGGGGWCGSGSGDGGGGRADTETAKRDASRGHVMEPRVSRVWVVCATGGTVRLENLEIRSDG